jgi:UDP:flavonoid glycosyltransferase YjiC (YdhE family)
LNRDHNRAFDETQARQSGKSLKFAELAAEALKKGHAVFYASPEYGWERVVAVDLTPDLIDEEKIIDR